MKRRTTIPVGVLNLDTVHPAFAFVVGLAARFPGVQVDERLGNRLANTSENHPMVSLVLALAAADHVAEYARFPAAIAARELARRCLDSDGSEVSPRDFETARGEIITLTEAVTKIALDEREAGNQPDDPDHPQAFSGEATGMVAGAVQSAAFALDTAIYAYMCRSEADATAEQLLEWATNAQVASAVAARWAFMVAMGPAVGAERFHGTTSAGSVLWARTSMLLDTMTNAYEQRVQRNPQSCGTRTT